MECVAFTSPNATMKLYCCVLFLEQLQVYISLLFLSSSRCDADPVPLAKYCVALARKDKSEDELKTFCNDQLEVFLQTGKDGRSYGVSKNLYLMHLFGFGAFAFWF